VIVREFRVNAGCEKDFESVFGRDGVWAELLQRGSEGFIETELQIVSPDDRSYKVRDSWKSHWDFELFRAGHQYEVEQFRKWLADKDLVAQETLLGSFYSDEPDGDEDAGLVQTS
jgi:hypothetical protein